MAFDWTLANRCCSQKSVAASAVNLATGEYWQTKVPTYAMGRAASR